MLFHKLPCVALLPLLLTMASCEEVLRFGAASDEAVRSITLETRAIANKADAVGASLEVGNEKWWPFASKEAQADTPHYGKPKATEPNMQAAAAHPFEVDPLPFPADSTTSNSFPHAHGTTAPLSAGAVPLGTTSEGIFSSSTRRRRRSSRQGKGGKRRRRRGGRRRRRKKEAPPTEPPPTTAPSPPRRRAPPTTPKPTRDTRWDRHSVGSVVLPDNMEYLNVGGCADSRGKFYGGVIVAGEDPPTYQKYKPKASEVPMTLQRCVDIVSQLAKTTTNGKVGIRGLRGLRYGACHFDGPGIKEGELRCDCYILGEGMNQLRQYPVEGQPEWPQQCCNPKGGGCWPCDFQFNGNVGGGKGPIASPGGGFAGVCYKLKNSFPA